MVVASSDAAEGPVGESYVDQIIILEMAVA